MTAPALDPHFRAVIVSGAFLVLDTETTGVGPTAEMCQIAILDSTGETLLNTLVKPQRSIPPDATRVHGITNRMVSDAPTCGAIIPQLSAFLTPDRPIVAYNAAFDKNILKQSLIAAGQTAEAALFTRERQWHCAMVAFSAIIGQPAKYGTGYRWQSLARAADYYHIPQPHAHAALDDCRTTLAVCRAMAGIGQD